MPSTPSAAVLLSYLTISGKLIFPYSLIELITNNFYRLLDKIAKQILVCEHKSIKVWDGTITQYKNYLRKKMISAGAV